MYTSRAQFLEKLLERVFYQNQKVSQENRKRGVQNTSDPTQERGKGAPLEESEGGPQEVSCEPRVEGTPVQIGAL